MSRIISPLGLLRYRHTSYHISNCFSTKMVNLNKKLKTDDSNDGDTSDNKKTLKVKLLTDNGFVPTRGSKFAAGYDLYAAYDAIIGPRGKSLIKTDIAVKIPSGYYGRVAARSGLAVKHSIDVGAGVIDEDYRGNVGVLLFNHDNEKEFRVTRGDRIAQLILEQIITPEIEQVDDLDVTERNDNGFGSTGISLKSPTKKVH